MSYPPRPPHRVLERSRSDRVISGVCGGVANYLNVDPTLVRVLTVVMSLFTGVPVVLYLIALFVIPEEGDPRRPGYPPVAGPPSYPPYPYPYQSSQPTPEPDYAPRPDAAPGPRQYGVPATEDDALWGPAGAPWQQPPPARGWPKPDDGAFDGPRS